MGFLFSKPVTEKFSVKFSNAKYFCGSSCMQGWRLTMEDAHTHLLSIEGFTDMAYVSLFDGHGGDEIANYANKKFLEILKKEFTAIGLDKNPNSRPQDIAKALALTFMKLDADIEDLQLPNVGSTANILVITDKKIYCANLGDSRSVVSNRGMAVVLSDDHKPNSADELLRIMEAGGFVSNFRINGTLALSRALGDYDYKLNPHLPPEKQLVIAVPDTTVLDMSDRLEFVVQACDGIWDVMTSQEVVNFIRCRIANGMSPEHICEDLMMNCLAPDLLMGGIGCDNMSVILFCFLRGEPYSKLSEKCRTFVPYQLCVPPKPPTNVTYNVISPVASTNFSNKNFQKDASVKGKNTSDQIKINLN